MEKSLFQQLAEEYSSRKIAFPELKAVTLAQWLLESGSGTSDLATKHLNFGGLKWRSEMTGIATPVHYKAHDGWDYYCKFASLDDFLQGYWRFIGRTPYDGWEEHAQKGPDHYIRFIGPIYCPPKANYADVVLSLVPKAQALLGGTTTEAEPLVIPAAPTAPKVVVIDPGHGGREAVGGSSPNNAISPGGEYERDWTLDLALRVRTAVQKKALEAGLFVRVIMTRETDRNLGLSTRAGYAKEYNADLFLSIHFNASKEHTATGVETWIHKTNVNKAEDREFAKLINDATFKAIKTIRAETRDREVWEGALGVINDQNLGNTSQNHPCRACLLEVEFMDTKVIEDMFSLKRNLPQTTKNRETVAEAIAEAIIAGFALP